MKWFSNFKSFERHNSKLNSFAATQKEMEATQRALQSTRIELRDTNSIVNDLSEKLNGKILIKKRKLLKRDATKSF